MAIHNSIKKYTINHLGSFIESEHFYTNDTRFSCSVDLNKGWQDGLLPDVTKTYAYIDIQFGTPWDRTQFQGGRMYNGWRFDILVDNYKQDYTTMTVKKPSVLCQVTFTDPTGVQQHFPIAPEIELIAERYQVFNTYIESTCFEEAALQLQVNQLEIQIAELNKSLEQAQVKLKCYRNSITTEPS